MDQYDTLFQFFFELAIDKNCQGYRFGANCKTGDISFVFFEVVNAQLNIKPTVFTFTVVAPRTGIVLQFS